MGSLSPTTFLRDFGHVTKGRTGRYSRVGYHPRIESKELASFLTTRSRGSELWFVNNEQLEQAILGYAAKLSARYKVDLYALAIEGNHLQAPAHFPKANRAPFMRDFNSCVARAVNRLTPEYSGGRFWARRYSSEFLPAPEDIEEYFFYTVLQPVQDGLVERISDYPGYNCFHDAVYGIERKYKVVNWAAYNSAKRDNPSVTISRFTEICTLRYKRLPGYEHLSQQEYASKMLAKLETHRVAAVQKRLSQGLGFLGREGILKTTRGSRPRKTKTSQKNSHRPRVLSTCPQRREKCKDWYFAIYFEYKSASERYRKGDLSVIFPIGTYPPPISRKILREVTRQ